MQFFLFAAKAINAVIHPKELQPLSEKCQMFVAMTSNIVEIGINKYTNMAEKTKRLSKPSSGTTHLYQMIYRTISPRQKALINSMDNCVCLIDGP